MCTRVTQRCEMTQQEVCQQVPIKVRQQDGTPTHRVCWVQVPFQSVRTVPVPPLYETRCQTRTEYTQKCSTRYVDEPYQVPVKRCKVSHDIVSLVL